MRNTHNYEDIIHLPHPVSATHPQMSLENRAAQFSPFAALTGHREAIEETARLTEKWLEPEEDKKEMLDRRLQKIRESLDSKPKAIFTYFKPDEKKNGGAYLSVTGRVVKINEYERRLLLEDGTDLSIDNLYSIEGELFRD